MGEAHPETLVALSSLGRAVEAQGRLGEAEEIMRRDLQLSRTALGEGHVDTVRWKRLVVQVVVQVVVRSPL